MTTEKPTMGPPTGLQARGCAFWHTVHAGWTLSADERELLLECCRALDVCEQLQEVLDQNGLMASGSAGQPRVHPALGELRATRRELAKLLAALGLPDPAGASVPSPSTVRARRAARARWGGGRDASPA
ncbi:MAG: P27 family phage terminase small subunit [Actinomycetota bacterium]|nr:P27 family phage terminase small subunit [Actinomycetota bacterium]